MIHDGVLREFACTLQSIPWSERGEAIRRFAKNAGVHPGTVYKKLRRETTWASHRKRRADAGKKKTDANPDELMKIVKLRQQTQWSMPMWRVIQKAEESGLVPAGKYKDWQVYAFVREKDVARRGIRGLQKGGHPSRNLVCERVNQVQQFDPSGCRQWRLYQDDDGRIGTESRRTEVYGYKTGKGKTAILRYLLTEKLTGAFFLRYYPGPGESAENMLDFLYRAWARKAHPVKFPFCGIPEQLWGDAGSAGKSSVVQNLLAQFEIAWKPHAVGNPRAKGSVESTHWIVEQAFETELTMFPCYSIDDLNERAEAFCARVNAERPHSRHKMTRSEAFCKIDPAQLRLPPERERFEHLCHTTPETRKIKSGGEFDFGGRSYRIPSNNYYVGDTVLVSICPFEHNAVFAIHRGRTYQCKEIATDAWGQARDENAVLVGEYKGIKYNQTQKTFRDLKGIELDPDAIKRDSWADIRADFPLLTPSEYSAPKPEEIYMSKLSAISRVAELVKQGAGRRLTDQEYDYLHEAFQERVPETTVRATVAFLTGRSGDGAAARIA